MGNSGERAFLAERSASAKTPGRKNAKESTGSIMRKGA